MSGKVSGSDVVVHRGLTAPSAMTESGVYYLVHDKDGSGKRLVRRHPPPPTSPPLDDDFDAITQGATATRAPNSRRHTQYTQPPLDDDFDAFTQDYTTNRGGGRVASQYSPSDGEGPTPSWLDGARYTETYMAYTVANSPRKTAPSASSRMAPGPATQHQNGHPRLRRTDRGPISHLNRLARDRLYRESGGRSSSGSVDLGKGKGRAEGLHRRTQSASSSHMLSRQPQISDGQLGKSKSMDPHGGGHGGGDIPLPGPTFEIVKRRVIEDGPEKIVTISTWREKVAQEASVEVGMSVYYVNPDDYAIEEEDHQTRIVAEVRQADSDLGRREHSPPLHAVQRPLTPRKTSSGSNQQSEALRTRTSSSPHANTSLNGIGILEPPSRLSPSPYPLFTTSTPHRRSSPSSKGRHKGSSPTTFTHSSSLLRQNRSTSMSSDANAVPWTSAAAKDILASCEPSLLHISSILASLGITTEAHLRAVGRLSDETRDREVKEEALRQGVTVMEWAILVDRLQLL
ncbi:hypothetical protein HGRIS_006191 [Hohenbuehelia grisea]|uniref:BRCT domain-containing protein n=1 Tax=Hohenbuehelia grisea TaxID=104357 RepID=A0ABR3K038_9AGAR